MVIHDISVPLFNGLPVFEGDPAVEVARVADFDRGDRFTLSYLKLSAHAGTHLDAPFHVLPAGATIDSFDLNLLMGPARVVQVGRSSGAIGVDELQVPEGTERILFKTPSSEFWGEPGFRRDYVSLSSEAAEWLVARGVLLVGIDYLSVDAAGSELPVHRVLLGANIAILEGLDLARVSPGEYRLICLPLRLNGAEGAPARAILIEE